MNKVAPGQIYRITHVRVFKTENLFGSVRPTKRDLLYTRIEIDPKSGKQPIHPGYIGYVLDDSGKVIPYSTFIVKKGRLFYGETQLPLRRIQRTKFRQVWISRRGRGEFDSKRPVNAKVVRYQVGKDGTRITLDKGVWDGVKLGWQIYERKPRPARFYIDYLNIRETTFVAAMTADQVRASRRYVIKPT